MLADAFEDEPERSRRESAVDQLVCVDRDLGDVLPWFAWKCGGGCLRKYRDHEAAEGRDARHPRIVRRAPADGSALRTNYRRNYRMRFRS
jgi:hypothetical protein